MTLSADLVLLASLCYVALLFGVAFWGDRRARQGRLGWLRNDPALHGAAARSARAAIDLGYRVAPLLYDLLYESLRADSRDDLRAALEVALEAGIHPDLHCAKLVADAARSLGDEAGLAAGRKFLERWSPHMPEKDRPQLAELLAGLK